MGPLRRLQEALTTTDDAQKTDTVELLWEMGPKPELDEWGEQNPYGQELAELVFVCTGVGLGLLIFYALYRCCLSCRACCCKEKMCTCVETKTKGKGAAFRLVLIFLLLGTLASLLSYSRGQVLIVDAVDSVAKSIGKVSSVVGSLQAIVGSCSTSVGNVTHAIKAIECGEWVPDDVETDAIFNETLKMLAEVNATLSALTPGLANFKETADDLEEELTASPSGVEPWNGKGRVQYWLEVGIPAFVSAPFVIFIVLSFLGLLFSCCKCKRPTACCLNLGACWAGGPGLTMALVIFVALFVVSITMADFCYLGPAAVLTERAEGNEYAGYYLSGCVGENPLGKEVEAVAAAVADVDTAGLDELAALPPCANINGVEVCPPGGEPLCTGVDAATAALNASKLVLDQAVLDLKRDVLNCSVFEPIIEHAFYDGVCDEAVEGLYSIWAVVVAAGVCTYMTLLVLPFATAAFAQDFFPAEKPEKKLYGGTSGIRHEELARHNEGASPLGRV
jgi:hypothetical protein